MPQEHGIVPTTPFLWRKQFGGLVPSHAAELQQLQSGNARPNKVVAARTLGADMSKKTGAMGG